MLLHRFQPYALIAASAFVFGCSSINPVHLGKFTFTGDVKDEAGKPVPNAWVKVRGWETLTDASGKWQQIQVVDCGTLREHMDSYEENDAILVAAEGFQPSEEKFIVKHPGYFQSCQAEQTIAFDTVLHPLSAEQKANKEAGKKISPPRESEIPWPIDTKKKKGKFSI